VSTITPAVGWYARLLRYDAWANGETLGSLRSGTPPAKAVRWMGHLVGAGELWLARLRNEPPAMAVWPDLDLERCAAGLARLAERWPRYLEALADDDLEEGVGYRNTRGEYWSSTVSDILTHVAMHGAYHRAQIAAAIRENGGEPAYTDFIHAVRQRLVP
jgi:uncharacterized damage-inducible protein DinB